MTDSSYTARPTASCCLIIMYESPVGGKARALAELTLADLPVPEWFVLVPESFDAAGLAPLQGRQLQPLLCGHRQEG